MYKEYGGSFYTRERMFSCQGFDKNLNTVGDLVKSVLAHTKTYKQKVGVAWHIEARTS